MSTPAVETTYLSGILSHVRQVVTQRKAMTDTRELERRAAGHHPRGFAAALRHAAETRPAVIAELKKASPSKGLIRAEFDPLLLAKEMEAAGAAALSVLTEERFFQGALENLQRASEVVSIPCLRKDFMVDPFQIVEARACGADAILLIAAALTDAELRTLRDEARRCELDVLCEVHDRQELERARCLDCECVGVNSRDLRTFQVSLNRACDLAPHLPPEAVAVAESGIGSRADMDRLRSAGYQAFLIGESLMRHRQPGTALEDLLAGA